MKMNKLVLLATLALGMTALPTFALDNPPPAGLPPQGGIPGPELKGPRPPRPLIEVTLDTNGDGIISAEEIANASAALKKLDKNGDGQLTPDEYHPPRPRPGQNAPDGQPGPGAPDQQPTQSGNGHQLPRGQRPPPPNQ
jgi:EF hand